MAIWISRYSNKELQSGKYYPVGISIGKPKWPLGYELRDQCYQLAPKGYMLQMDIVPFTAIYEEKLDNIGIGNITRILEGYKDKAKKEGKEVVLLCYEDVRKEGEWCHRTIFANWWRKKTGEIIRELHDPSVPKEKKPTVQAVKEDNRYKQMSLFDMS